MVAAVYNSTGEDYYKTLYLFLIIACFAIMNSVYLIYLDHINNNVINTNVFIEEEGNEGKSLVRNEERNEQANYGTVKKPFNTIKEI